MPQANRSVGYQLVELLLHRPAVSRAELGSLLGLSRARIGTELQRLGSAGILSQRPAEPSDSLGRPPLQVSLARDAAFGIGLELGSQKPRGVLCDLHGGLVTEARAMPGEHGHSERVGAELVDRLLRDVPVSRARVIGVGIASACPDAGGSSSEYVEGDLELSQLESLCGFPVLVDTEANASAVYEHRFGAGFGLNDLLYLHLSERASVGIIAGGKTIRGAHGLSGQLGHVRLAGDGLICECGNRGCLWTMASPSAIAGQLAHSRGAHVSWNELVTLAEKGDRAARRALADAGALIGEGIAMAVNLLNPELVLIGGDLAAAGDALLAPVRASIERSAAPSTIEGLRVAMSSAGQRAVAMGAAALQLMRAPEAIAARLAQQELATSQAA